MGERYRLQGNHSSGTDTGSPPVNPDFVLPCDVHLYSPNVTVQQGCKLSTLLVASQVREKARRSVADVIADELRATK
jgi:hypothetical protein